MIRFAMLCAGLLFVGSPALAQTVLPEGPIVMEGRSWGAIYAAWSIAPDGTATFTEREATDDARYEGRDRYWLRTRKANVGADGYRRIRALFLPLATLGADAWKCGPGFTDGPYGSVLFGEGPPPKGFSFDSNCASEGTEQLYAAMKPAEEWIGEWTRGGAIVARVWAGDPKDEPKEK